jgi:hypothetical protein
MQCFSGGFSKHFGSTASRSSQCTGQGALPLARVEGRGAPRSRSRRKGWRGETPPHSLVRFVDDRAERVHDFRSAEYLGKNGSDVFAFE